MNKKPADKTYIPPTYLHNMRYHLGKIERKNVSERDKRLIQYIRSLQELRQKSGIYRLFTKVVKI
ncbi:MAG: hypothetical protein ACOY30_03960 [Bacillota bacterium]